MIYIKYLPFIFILLTAACSQQAPRPVNYIPVIPDSDKVAYEKGIAFIIANDYQSAERLFLDLTDDNDEISGPWVNLGLLYYKTAQFDKAEKAIKTALEIKPSNSYALNISGMLAIKGRNFKKALDQYRLALKSMPDNALAHYNIALLYDIYFQDVAAASNHYRKYLSIINNSDQQTADWLEQISAYQRKL